jgi:RimJ/RimL family protein N-acetyltransferase
VNNFSWAQEILSSNRIVLLPLQPANQEDIFALASDPLVWEQHPNRNRYQPEEFNVYFEGALKSGGAYRIVENKLGLTMGCTRYYDFDESEKSVLIGYTFIGRSFWGRGYNQELKQLMVAHAFHYINIIRFHIGATNFRSQRSIEKFGAIKTGELDVAYYGEATKKNFIYEISNPIQR